MTTDEALLRLGESTAKASGPAATTAPAIPNPTAKPIVA